MAPRDAIFSWKLDFGPCRSHVGICPADDIDGPDVEDGLRDSREYAGHEQVADRLTGEDAVQNETHAGGDENAHGAAGRNAPGRQPLVVLIPSHLRHGDLAHGGRRCGTGPADGGKPGACSHRGRGQSAPHAPDPLVGSVVEVFPDTHVGDDNTHQHEERDRRDGVVGDSAVRDRCQHRKGGFEPREEDQPPEAHKHHGQADRHSGIHQDKEDTDANSAKVLGTHRFTALVTN